MQENLLPSFEPENDNDIISGANITNFYMW